MLNILKSHIVTWNSSIWLILSMKEEKKKGCKICVPWLYISQNSCIALRASVLFIYLFIFFYWDLFVSTESESRKWDYWTQVPDSQLPGASVCVAVSGDILIQPEHRHVPTQCQAARGERSPPSRKHNTTIPISFPHRPELSLTVQCHSDGCWER